MKVIDMIFVSFYSFYTRPGKVIFSTPQQYTTYVFAFGTLLWLLVLDGTINHYVYNKMEISIEGFDSVITIFSGLIISAFIYYMFYRRYIKTSLYLKLYEHIKARLRTNHFGVLFRLYIWCFLCYF